MSDFLEMMARTGRARVKEALSRETLAALMRRAADTASPPVLAHHASRFDLIAEIKLIAPSLGNSAVVAPSSVEAIPTRAAWYAEAGAAMVSVLTEPTVFSGHLDHLRAASRVCPVPTMRKDFLVDPYQIFEARACGAGGVLLIARMLDDTRLAEMIDAAGQAGLLVLVEAFDAGDLARIASLLERSVGPPPRVLVGINCRDLTTLAVDPRRLAIPPAVFPAGVTRVAESGMASPDDTASAAALGYDMALVGNALMRFADPRPAVRGMIEAGRAARHASGGNPCTSG